MADSDNCCLLVGNLKLVGVENKCIISVNKSCKTEVIMACGTEFDPLPGPSIVSLNITGYASTDMWSDCPAAAGVSIPFIQKYDCETDEVHFIFNGRGQSYINGPVSSLATLYKTMGSACDTLSANSSSGPFSLYTLQEQTTGYGLIYTGDPFSFKSDPNGIEIDCGTTLGGTYYLQSFNLTCQPGQLPTATYSLVAGTTLDEDS